jgi:hypothetical protein
MMFDIGSVLVVSVSDLEKAAAAARQKRTIVSNLPSSALC